MSAQVLDEVFVTEVRSIFVARERWWKDLHDFNRAPVQTGAAMDALQELADETDARVDVLRGRYFPRATRLVVQNGKVMTVSPTARSIRVVWREAGR